MMSVLGLFRWIRDPIGALDESEVLAREIRTRQFHAALQLVPFTSATNVLIGAATAWTYRDLAPVVPTLIWFALLVGLEIDSIRSYRLSIAVRRMIQPRDLRRFAVQSGLVAALFGIAVMYLLPRVDAEHRMLIATAAAGIIGTGAFVLAPVPFAGLAWIAMLGIGSAAGLILIGGPIHLAILVLLVSYGVLMVVTVLFNSHLLVSRVRAEAQAERQSQVVGLLLKDFEGSARDWLWEVDGAGNLRHVSLRLAEALGRDAEVLTGASVTRLLRDTFPNLSRAEAMALDALQSRLDGRRAFRDQIVPVMVGGELRWWALTAKPLLDEQGEFHGWRGVGSDTTEIQRRDIEMTRLANFDSLTDLANRRQFQACLDALMPLGTLHKGLLLIVLDLDNFKAVNDTLGHLMGDQMLREVARRLSPLAGEGEVLARLGGDEYALIVPGEFSDEQCIGRAQSLLAALREPCFINSVRIELRGSVGMACAPRHGGSADQLLKAADAALYASKDAGRDTVRLFDAQMDALARHRLSVLTDLRDALERNELELHYQPQINVFSRTIVGFEALLRWRHPQRGMLSPNEFIPIAEETGMIVPIGAWVLRRACIEAAKWPAHMLVAVNLSAVQFASRELIDDVRGALSGAEFPPERLELEITESSLIHDSSGARDTMNALRALGVHVALDDFGTGYSSLAYLRSFPLDKLKIDRAFTHALEHDEQGEASAIVRAIVQLATALKLRTTAEGVETANQMEALRARGCSEMQGYYFAKPIPPEKIRGFIEEWRAGHGATFAHAVSATEPL
jgi:diguanylate cyclase (GGDEF)-like protein